MCTAKFETFFKPNLNKQEVFLSNQFDEKDSVKIFKLIKTKK